MKIVIPGGSGQVGNILARTFQKDGHEVVVLGRNPTTAPWRVVAWDANSLGDWAEELEGADVVINLAGRSVNCRYGPANRQAIIESRVNSTRIVGEAIMRAKSPPRIWLQMSTATIYAHSYDAPNDEEHGIIGGTEPNVPEMWNFSIDVATAWERAANEAQTPHTRKVLMRSAIVLSSDRGGIFDVLLRLVRFGLGGTCGDGRQFVSWIHCDDFVRSIYYLIEHASFAGPANLCAPKSVPERGVHASVAKSLGRAFGTPGDGLDD